MTLKFEQLQNLAAQYNCVLERSRMFGCRYSLYDNNHYVEHFCKNLEEVTTELYGIMNDLKEETVLP